MVRRKTIEKTCPIRKELKRVHKMEQEKVNCVIFHDFLLYKLVHSILPLSQHALIA